VQEELGTLGLQAQAFTRAQARQAELQKAVRSLQEQLADTNMVIDKVGGGGLVLGWVGLGGRA
jgi:hypothetical protein